MTEKSGTGEGTTAFADSIDVSSEGFVPDNKPPALPNWCRIDLKIAT